VNQTPSGNGDNTKEIILDNPANTFTTIPEDYLGVLGFTSDGALGNVTNGISINVGNHLLTTFFNHANDGLRFESNNITLNANRAINLVGSENINVQSYSGTIAGPITGNALNKYGAGTLTVNGAGSLSNATTVVAGTLRLNSTWTGTTLTVNSGATLGGTGSISAAVTNGGTLAIGPASPATLTVTSNLTFGSGGTASMNINAATGASDHVAGINKVTFGGSLVVANLGGTPTAGQAYHLFNAASYVGNFASVTLPSAGSGNAWNWDPTTGTLSVVTSVSTTPTNITKVISGGKLTLSWPADHIGWRLLSNSVGLASTNWFLVPGSDTTNQVIVTPDPSKPSVFFKLVYP
jgi:autotransporter-associated beta strand protein